MLQKLGVTCVLLAVASCSYETGAATTGELIKCEGLASLLFGNEAPDCVCRYCRPDYCKKPLPCPCGPLPPNLSGGCGPTRPWSIFCWSCEKGGCGAACCDQLGAAPAGPAPPAGDVPAHPQEPLRYAGEASPTPAVLPAVVPASATGE